jgi:ribitol-5-phosphate 2-dehydrogenase
MLPNIHDENSCNNLKENYDRNSKFRGSSCDGFMQNNVVCKKSNVIKIEKDQVEVVFLELMSVVFNALDSFDAEVKLNNNTIAIYGDGSLGYIASLIIKKKFKNSKIIVIGKNKSKLDYFTFADERYTIDKIPEDLKFDHAFECVGGIGSEGAIESIIDKINPQGIINLMGVSEYSVNINTRMVLEKGLRLVGNSRSSYDDFKASIEFIKMYPDVLNYLSNIVSNVVDVRNINDINTAFMMDTTNMFKTVMKWDI